MWFQGVFVILLITGFCYIFWRFFFRDFFQSVPQEQSEELKMVEEIQGKLEKLKAKRLEVQATETGLKIDKEIQELELKLRKMGKNLYI